MNNAPKDLTGRTFTFLTALRPTGERESGAVVWECRCVCGNLTKASVRQLRAKHRTSCGCRRNAPRERINANCKKCGEPYKKVAWGPKSEYCTQCRAIIHESHIREYRERRSANRDRIIVEREAIGQCNACGIRPHIKGRKLCEVCTLSRRTSYLKWKYGLNHDEVSAQLERQHYLCAICRGEMSIPHIDHHHGNGTFRGILCRPCNQALGLFKDNPTLIQRAAEYVRWNGFGDVQDLEVEAA